MNRLELTVSSRWPKLSQPAMTWAVIELWPSRDHTEDAVIELLAVTELWPRRDHWAPEPWPPIDVTKINVLHLTISKWLICSWYQTIYIKICTYICRIKIRVCEQILMVFRNQYISNTHRKIQWVKQLNVNATIPTRKTEWPTIIERHVFIYSNLLSTISWIWGNILIHCPWEMQL